MPRSTGTGPERPAAPEECPANDRTNAADGKGSPDRAPGADPGADPEQRGTTLELDAEELRRAHAALQAQLDAAGAGTDAEAADDSPEGARAGQRSRLLLLGGVIAAVTAVGTTVLLLGNPRSSK